MKQDLLIPKNVFGRRKMCTLYIENIDRLEGSEIRNLMIVYFD